MTNQTHTEFKVDSKELVSKIKELIKAGNIRRITIKNSNEKTIVEIPLTIGVAGVIIAPVLAAVGAIAALVSECTVSIEKYA
jgi:integral membrane sensor domain MASE1